MTCSSYLQSKLVEGVVEQILEARYEALVQSVPSGSGEKRRDGGWGALQLAVVVSLVAVHSGLKHQQHQHDQMFLFKTGRTKVSLVSLTVLFKQRGGANKNLEEIFRAEKLKEPTSTLWTVAVHFISE